MKQRLLLASAVTIILTLSCKTKTTDEKYNAKTYNEDVNSFVKEKAISDSDKVLLTSYIASKQNDTAALNNSYKTLLSEAKNIEQQRLQQQAKQKELNEQLVIRLKGKKVVPVFRNGIWNNEIILTANFKNTSSRTISGFSFRLNF